MQLPKISFAAMVICIHLACAMMDLRYETVYPPDGSGITASSLLIPSRLLNSSKPPPLLNLGYA